MNGEPVKVLFLCTGNSARSIMAEAILNDRGRGTFLAYSAGSHPAGRVNPAAIDRLKARGHATEGLRSKSWDEFSGSGAPALNYVITVCDDAAAEACPIWSGGPVCAHWGIPDPASAAGSPAEIRQAFDAAYRRLERRIDEFVALPLGLMDDAAITDALATIGTH